MKNNLHLHKKIKKMSGYIPEQQPEPIQSISFERLADNTIVVTCNGFKTVIENYCDIISRKLTKSNPRIVVKSKDEKIKYVFLLSKLLVGGVAWPGTNVDDAIRYIMGNYFGSGTPSGKLDQTITFAALANRPHTDPAFNLVGTASSGLTVAFASSDATKFTVAGTLLTPVASGTANVTASQAGNAVYNAAINVVRPLTLT